MEWHDRFWPEPSEPKRQIRIGFQSQSLDPGACPFLRWDVLIAADLLSLLLEVGCTRFPSLYHAYAAWRVW
jgi:hypothetical protein